MTMSENRRRELMGMSQLGREMLEQSGQVTFEQPTSNLTPAQKRDVAVLQAELDKIQKGIDELERAKLEESLRVDPGKVNAALALSTLGQQVLMEQRAQSMAEDKKAAANKVKPTDKYLEMTGLGQQSLSYRKSGGKS